MYQNILHLLKADYSFVINFLIKNLNILLVKSYYYSLLTQSWVNRLNTLVLFYLNFKILPITLLSIVKIQNIFSALNQLNV